MTLLFHHQVCQIKYKNKRQSTFKEEKQKQNQKNFLNNQKGGGMFGYSELLGFGPPNLNK